MSEQLTDRPKGSKDMVKRPGRKDLSWSGNEDMEPGDNSRFVCHALLSASLPPIDISDAEQVQERIMWYFNQCQRDDVKPGVAGLCNALGVSRQEFYNWSVGNNRAATHTAVVQKAKRILEEVWECFMLQGKINPVTGIFLGKNC